MPRTCEPSTQRHAYFMGVEIGWRVSVSTVGTRIWTDQTPHNLQTKKKPSWPTLLQIAHRRWMRRIVICSHVLLSNQISPKLKCKCPTAGPWQSSSDVISAVSILVNNAQDHEQTCTHWGGPAPWPLCIWIVLSERVRDSSVRCAWYLHYLTPHLF